MRVRISQGKYLDIRPSSRAAEPSASHPVKTADDRRVNHKNPFVRCNARFGLQITLVLGTMWGAYVFSILALSALPSAMKQGTY